MIQVSGSASWAGGGDWNQSMNSEETEMNER